MLHWSVCFFFTIASGMSSEILMQACSPLILQCIWLEKYRPREVSEKKTAIVYEWVVGWWRSSFLPYLYLWQQPKRSLPKSGQTNTRTPGNTFKTLTLERFFAQHRIIASWHEYQGRSHTIGLPYPWYFLCDSIFVCLFCFVLFFHTPLRLYNLTVRLWEA